MAAYKILSFNEAQGQLCIEFATGMAPLNIDVPIKDGLFIVGEELEEYIQGFIPTWHLDRVAQLNAGIANSNELKSLVNVEAPVELPTVLTPEQEIEKANQEMWENLKFQSDIAKVLVKFGLLETDPTVIPTQQVG